MKKSTSNSDFLKGFIIFRKNIGHNDALSVAYFIGYFKYITHEIFSICEYKRMVYTDKVMKNAECLTDDETPLSEFKIGRFYSL